MKIRSLIVSVILTAGAALAQDPPSRVARLNWLEGNVSFQPSGTDTWAPATLNFPLTTGDHLYTDRGGRAEMHVGPNAIRLDGETNFGFLNLDDRTVQTRFTEGSMEIRLRRLEDDDIYEVDAPQGAISLLRTGDYRVDTDPGRNATMLTVWSGEADVLANGRSFIVYARQTAFIADGQEPDIRTANPVDDFDHFTADRNLREDRIPPPVHVSQSMVGYEDLDEYGSWNETPDYGWVWAPRVIAGWAPYHQGRWAWVDPWGWTWIDEAPWGFAPFHYGRWAFLRSSWVWVPGAVTARPVYAPALVAFVGGPRFSLSLNIGPGGAVAWFPLGPREPFYPAYRVSNTYIRQVNITHVRNVEVNNFNVTNIRYVNQQVPGAVVAMPQQGFATSRPVREFGQRVPAQQLAQGEVIGFAPPVTPRRESLLGVQTNRTVASPSREVITRPVVVRTAPPPPPVSFAAREPMLQQNNGRPLATEQLQQLRQEPGAVINRAPVRTFPAQRPGYQVSPRPAVPVTGEQLPARQPDRPERVRPQETLRPQETPRPQENRTFPVPQGPPPRFDRPEINRPAPVRPQPEARPPQENRPQPEFRPQPQMRPPEARPQPEMRRENPVREVRPEAGPRPQVREARPEPKREEKKQP